MLVAAAFPCTLVPWMAADTLPVSGELIPGLEKEGFLYLPVQALTPLPLVCSSKFSIVYSRWSVQFRENAGRHLPRCPSKLTHDPVLPHKVSLSKSSNGLLFT